MRNHRLFIILTTLALLLIAPPSAGVASSWTGPFLDGREVPSVRWQNGSSVEEPWHSARPEEYARL